MKIIYKAPRGVHDIFGINALAMNFLENKSREIFKRRGFEEMKTPIFEDAALFVRSIGQTSDIVEKEMYIFEDKKGRKLALRPEGTASLVRAFIEHRWDVSVHESKFFYAGEMFRYERPQTGRYRQFHQIGAEYFGSLSPAADAEIIALAQDLLVCVGIKDTDVHINSLGCENCRPLFREALIEYFNSVKDLCGDCVRRLKKNPLRLLDCKIDSRGFTGVPRMPDYLCKDCKDNFSAVQSLLKSINYNFTIDGKLIRGLDYYTRTVFEIHSNAVGSQDALAAGGRYDGLVKELGGKNTPAVGFALGSQRVLLAAEKIGFFNSLQIPEKIFIAVADQSLFNEAFSFAVKTARNGLKNNKNVSVFGPLDGKSLTNQLKFADKIQASKTIVFARTEFERSRVLLKNMKNKTQAEIAIDEL